MDLHKQINKEINRLGTNKTKLSKKSGIDDGAISNIMYDSGGNLSSAIRLAKFLGVEVGVYEPQVMYEKLINIIKDKHYSNKYIAKRVDLHEQTFRLLLKRKCEGLRYDSAARIVEFIENEMNAKKEELHKEAPKTTLNDTTTTDNANSPHLDQCLNLLKATNTVIDKYVDSGEISELAGMTLQALLEKAMFEAVLGGGQ
ncbi:MAG: hypothetical protein Q4A55_03450 [Aerococcus sp.]|nr:hypothetical protein [Aerococcus sp.]